MHDVRVINCVPDRRYLEYRIIKVSLSRSDLFHSPFPLVISRYIQYLNTSVVELKIQMKQLYKLSHECSKRILDIEQEL